MLSRLASTVIPARNFTNASRSSADMRVIGIHTMESPELPSTAEDVAHWAAGPTAPDASWHYAVDNNSIVGCVQEEDVAWAMPGANHDGIQIELAGRARQTAQDWADAYSRAELVLGAKLVADVCKRRRIPAKHLTNTELRDGKRGVVGHVQASQVYKRSDHTDPGPNFPWAKFMRDVRGFMPDTRRWQWRLTDAKGKVLDRSSIVGTAGLSARLVLFTTRVAPKVAKLTASGRGPRIRPVRL